MRILAAAPGHAIRARARERTAPRRSIPASGGAVKSRVPRPMVAMAGSGKVDGMNTTPSRAYRTPLLRRLAWLAAALALLAAAPVIAWSALGHKLVGDLAQRHLTPAANAEVARLLAGEANPTLAGVATW